MPTDQTLISTFLKKHSIFDAAEVDRITKLAHAVSAIPWGEGRTIEEVLSTKGVGTCTGKHLVLQKCFDALGIVWRPVVCTFRWSEQGLHLAEHLEKILQEGEWEHGHNFVQVQNQNTKQWIDVDVTWDPHSLHTDFWFFRSRGMEKLHSLGCEHYYKDGTTPRLRIKRRSSLHH